MLIKIFKGLMGRKRLPVVVGLVLMTALSWQAPAQAANPTAINFQGKVVNADGTNVTNGSYSFIFRLYDSSSPTTSTSCAANSSCWWEETDSLTVTNGVFQVELGATCAFTSACNSGHSGIDFNTNNALYLTFKFNGDAAGFMSPTIHLDTVPYAFNADKLGGLGSGNFLQLAQGVQTDSSTTNASIFVNKTGTTANILDLQRGGSDILLLDNAGLLTYKPYTGNDNATAFEIQNAAASESLFAVDTTARSASGGNLVKIGNSTGTDTATTILKVDSATADPTTNLAALNGGLFYNSTGGHLEVIEGGAVKIICNKTDLGCGSTTDLQTAYTNSTAPATITTADSKDLKIVLADTTTDSNFLVNVATGSTGKFAVQSNGSDVFLYSASSGLSSNNNNFTLGSGTGTAATFNATTGLNTGGTQRVDSSGNFVNAGNYTGTGAVALSSGGSGNLSLTGASGTVNLGAVGTSTSSSTLHLSDTSNATGTQTVTIGSNANAANGVDIDAGNTGLLEIGDTTTAHTIKIGAGGAAAGNVQAVTIGSNTTSTASTVTLQAGNVNTTNNQAGIIVGGGFSTSDTNLVPLVVDSTTSFTETANTCTSTVNDGALYFNSNTGSMALRACLNGSWEDLVSTATAFFAFFGVVPDSGSATAVPGDIQSLSTANSTGPCRVYWVANGATSQVGVRDCVAFSGGRKVVVAAATLNIAAANNNFFHICLTGTNNQPAVSTGSTTESANLGTVSLPSATGPILCLADVKTSTNAITGIYDTRVFTTTTKEFGYSAAALSLGVMVKPDATNANRLNLPGTTATGFIRGVVVASNGAAWASGGPNIIIATAGDSFVKATAGSPSATASVQNSTTTSGYALTAAAVTTAYANLGIAQSTFSNTCTSVSNCNSSLLVNLNIK